MADVRFSVLSSLVVLPLSAELPQLPLVQVPAPPSTLTTPLTARKLPLHHHSQSRFKLSACLNSLPLLVQTSSVFVFVSDRFVPLPPSQAQLRCNHTTCGQLSIVSFSNCKQLRWCSPLSQPRAPVRQPAPLVCLSVCLSEPYRSNFVVPARFRDLCALIENRVRSAGAHIGHCPSQRKNPNVGTLS